MVNTYVTGQVISYPISEGVFCYLTINNKDKDKSFELMIYNGINDNFVIHDFNKQIHHESAFYYNRDENRVFFWKMLTISNQEPKDIVIILPQQFNTKKARNQLAEKNQSIVIAPNSVFVSDVYMLSSPFVSYPKGYYKLCLYYKEGEKSEICVAEIVVKHE